ncbi:MAG: hypothetical protein ACRCUC_00275 [Aestuariivirga sp.]
MGDIRELELAVIREAINARDTFGAILDKSPLALATDALIAAMPSTRPKIDPELGWIASTFLHIEQGDRLRIGQEEATVTRLIKQEWMVDNSDPYRPKSWPHVEVRADVGFGLTEFPSSTPVEILCDADRKAMLTLSEAGLRPRYCNNEEERGHE